VVSDRFNSVLIQPIKTHTQKPINFKLKSGIFNCRTDNSYKTFQRGVKCGIRYDFPIPLETYFDV
jgi:hypothetical protein